MLERLIINYLTEVTDRSLAKFRTLKVLQCVGCEEVYDDGIITLMLQCPELEILDVSLTSIGDRTVEAAMYVVERRENPIPLKLALGFTSTFIRNTPQFVEENKPALLEIISETLLDMI